MRKIARKNISAFATMTMRPSDKILATSEIILKLDRVTAFMHSPGSLPHAFGQFLLFPLELLTLFRPLPLAN